MLMVRLFCVLPLAVFSSHSFSDDLIERYREVSESFWGGELVVSCGGTVLKLAKRPWSSAELYWKNEIDWVLLEDVKLHDAGFSFPGLGRQGGLSIEQLKRIESGIDEPGYRFLRGHSGYFSLREDEGFTPYHYRVDAYGKSMYAENIYQRESHFDFDRGRYLRDASEVSPFGWGRAVLGVEWYESQRDEYIREMSSSGHWDRESDSHLEYLSNEVDKALRASQEYEIAKEEAIEEAAKNVERFGDGVTITIPPGAHEQSSYCRVLS